MLDGMERISPLILTTKTGQSFKKRYFARLWDETTVAAGLEKVTLPGFEEPVRLHFHDLRGTTVTLLSESGSTQQQIATITGYRILERYLARTSGVAEQAILNWENSESLQPRREKLMPNKQLIGAPEEIRTPDPQIRRLFNSFML